MATEYVVRARFTGDARDLTRAATEARTDLTQLGQSAAAAGQQMARQGAQADTSAKAVQAAATAAKAAARSQLDLAAAEQQAATSAARATAARAGGDRMTDARQQRALAAAAAATTIALRDQAAQLVTSAQSAAAAAAGYADLTAQIRAAGLAARRPVGAPAAADEAGGDTGGQSMSRQQRAIASALKGASAALDANAAALARAQAAAESAGSTYTTTAEAIYGVTRAARSLAAEAQVLTVSAAREAAAQQATTAALVQGAKARLVLAGASDRAAAATANLRGSNDNLARSAGSAARSLADQARQAQGLHAVTGAVTAVLGAARGHLIGLASVAGAALVTRKVAAYADSWTSVSSRLSLVTQGSAELARAQADLFRTAQDTRSEFVGAANLFATLSRQAQTLGASYKQLLLSTTAIGQAFVVSGASAESYQQAIIQLGQGLSAGAVMGEELNSILEQAPRLAQAIADGLGVGVAELKALGSEGKLTSKAIFEAILKEAPKIEAEFARMKPTISGAFTVLNNAALQWIGQADQASGASADVAQAIMGLADNLDGAATVVGVLGAVVTATLIGRALGPLAAATSVAAAGTKAMWQAVQDGTAIGLGSSAEMQARARHTLTLAKAQAHGTELTLGAAKAELAHAEAMATATKGAASWQTRVVEAAANVAAAEAAHAAATDRVRTAQTALATALQATTLRARAATTAMAALNAVGGGWGLSITALTLGVGYLATRTTDADKATEAWTDRITAADKALRELTETGKARAEQIKTEQDNLRAAAEAEAALAEARATAAQALADRTGAQWGIGGVALRVVGLDQARELGEAAKVARQQLSLLRATIGDYVGEVGGAARWTGGLRREITSLADVTASAVKPLGELLTKTRDLQAQRTAFGSGGETALREVQAAQQARDLLADAAKDRTQGAQAQLAYVVEQARAIGIAGKTAEEVLTNLAKASKDAEAGLASDQRQRQIQAELRGAKEVAAAAKVSAAAEREADLRARARVEALGQVDRTEQQIYETLLAQSDAERAGDEARRGRQTAQDLDLARQELALAGASTRERERALALARVNADLKARDISLTSDIARAEHERALAAIDAASAIEDAGALKAGQDRLKALDAEIKTIGQGAAARAEAVAVEQVQQSLRERSIALTSRQAGEEIKLAKQAAQRAAILKAGDEAADMDAQAAAAERMTVAITAGGDAVRAAARDEYARA
ncbi:tape measure protein, partial [Tistrella sp.]